MLSKMGKLIPIWTQRKIKPVVELMPTPARELTKRVENVKAMLWGTWLRGQFRNTKEMADRE